MPILKMRKVKAMPLVKIDVYHGTRSKSFTCEYADVTFSGTFNARFKDSRKLLTIGKDFDGADSITVHMTLRDEVHTGYSDLVYITRDGEFVDIKMAKPENSEV